MRLPGAALIVVLALGACSSAPVETAGRLAVETGPLPAMKVFGTSHPGHPGVPNGAITRDFLELAFQMESGRTLPVLTRFEGPVTLALTGAVPASASPDLARLLARLRTEAGIDIRQVKPSEPHSITVEFMARRTMQALVPQAACFVVPRVTSWSAFRLARHGAAVDWTTLQTREHAAVFIPNDTSPQEIRDCLHEEIAQALGPLNDLYRLPDSVFNDDNFHTVLTGFDMLVLRAYYAPELRSGMTRADVSALLPGVLARLNPGADAGGGQDNSPTARPWIEAIETALGPHAGSTDRLRAATRALALAQSQGWQDARLAFSYFALGRLSIVQDPEAALAAFAAAGKIYRRLPGAEVHAAHVDMQLAAFALSANDPELALGLINRSLAPVAAAENATLLATMLMIKAQALVLQGRPSEAELVRLDSLGWARYGFGPDDQVRTRLAEIAALAPGAKRAE